MKTPLTSVIGYLTLLRDEPGLSEEQRAKYTDIALDKARRLEELVGEIWDEHDEVIEIFRKQPDGSYIIACSADLDDMYDLFQVKGNCDAATVSGWVLEQVGRVPEAGDHFQAEGLDVTVTKVEHRRVLEIQVRVLEETT